MASLQEVCSILGIGIVCVVNTARTARRRVKGQCDRKGLFKVMSNLWYRKRDLCSPGIEEAGIHEKQVPIVCSEGPSCRRGRKAGGSQSRC